MTRDEMLQSIINLIEILSFDSVEQQTLDGATHLIGRAARDIFRADSYAFVTINPVTGDLLNPMRIVNLDSNNEEVAIPIEVNPDILNIFGLQAIASLDDLPERDQYTRIFESVQGVKSIFGMAMGKKGTQKPIAIVFLGFTEDENFCEEAKSILRVFINHASPVLRNLWLLHRYQEVQRIGQEINQELETPDKLFQQLQENISTLLDTSCFFMVATYQPNTDTVDYYMSQYGKILPVTETPVEGGGTAWVIRKKKSLLIRNFRNEMSSLPVDFVHLAGTDTVEPQSLIYVPLLFRDAILGVISIQHKNPNIFDDDDVQILKLLGNQIAMALNNMRLFRNLRSLNETGQTLTRQLDSKEVLQTVVDEIRERTKTDIVILFPYVQAQMKFDLPPTMSGKLHYPNSPRLRESSPDDISTLALNHGAPVFENSADLYEKLGGQPDRRLGNFEQREQLSSTAMVPLRVGDETVGVLFINYRQPQRFDAPQKHLILGLSNYAAIAIENSRKFSELIRNRTQELNILRTIAREISKTLDLDQILNTILCEATEHLQQRVGFEGLDAAVLLYNAAEHCLEVKAAYGRSAATRLGHKIFLSNDKGITRWVYENKQSARVDNVLTDPLWSEIYYSVDKDPDTKSELDVPLIIEDNFEGILNFESRETNVFTEADEDFLWNLAEQAVLAIRNAKAYAEQMRIAEQLSTFGTVGKKLAEARAYEEVCNNILESGLKAVNANAGQVVMLDHRAGELYMVVQKGAKQGMEHHRQSINDGVVGWAIRNKQTVNCKIDEKPWSDIYLPIIPNVYFELVAPIMIDGQAHGAINIERQVDRPFTDQDKQYLEAMASIASTALQNATNVQRAAEGRLRLSVLRNIDQQIISQLGDSHKVMTLILEDAIKQTDAETGNLYLFRDAKPESTYFAERGANGAWKIVRQISTELKPLQLDEVSATVAQNRTPAMVPRNGENAAQSVIAAPLVSGDELVGVLNVRSNVRQAFNEEDKELLTLLAGQAVIAIQHARAYAQSKAAEKLFSRLYDTGRELAKFTDMSEINDVYEAIITAAEKLTPPKSKVLIWRYEEAFRDTKPLKLAAQGSKPTAQPPERMGMDEGVNGLVCRIRKQVVVPDAKNPPPGVTPAVYDPNTRSIVVTPILFDKYYYGNVALSNEEAFHFRDSKDPEVRLMRGLTRQLAITLNRLDAVQAQREAEDRNKEGEIMTLFGQGAFGLSHRIENDLGLVRSYVNNVKGHLKSKRAIDAEIADKLQNVLGMLSNNSNNGGRELELIKSHLEDLTTMLEDKGIHDNDILIELENVVHDVSITLALSDKLKQDIVQFEREGALNLPREVVPTLVLLSEAKRDFPPFPTNRTITLIDDGCTDDLGNIYVVPRHIVSILTTFVSNAIDAMPNGGTITVTARNAQGQIALEVSDTGIGIPKEIQPKVFKFLYSTKGSSGFGLWSAYRYARINAGSITVTSEPGIGTTFTLTLPTTEDAPRGN